jgi:hypothetical protein
VGQAQPGGEAVICAVMCSRSCSLCALLICYSVDLLHETVSLDAPVSSMPSFAGLWRYGAGTNLSSHVEILLGHIGGTRTDTAPPRMQGTRVMSQEDRAAHSAAQSGRMKACEVPRFPQATASCNPGFAPNISSRSVSTEETGAAS